MKIAQSARTKNCRILPKASCLLSLISSIEEPPPKWDEIEDGKLNLFWMPLVNYFI